MYLYQSPSTPSVQHDIIHYAAEVFTLKLRPECLFVQRFWEQEAHRKQYAAAITICETLCRTYPLNVLIEAMIAIPADNFNVAFLQNLTEKRLRGWAKIQNEKLAKWLRSNISEKRTHTDSPLAKTQSYKRTRW